MKSQDRPPFDWPALIVLVVALVTAVVTALKSADAGSFALGAAFALALNTAASAVSLKLREWRDDRRKGRR